MRRGSRYAGAAPPSQEWNDDVASDYSQDDNARQPPSVTNMHLRPSSREKPTGIPRPGVQTLRTPNAAISSRVRSYSSSSSTESRTVDESIPPVPQISQARSRTGTSVNVEDVQNTGAGYSHDRPQSSFSRRPSSISRPRSRSHSKTSYISSENPPPLPGSNSDSDSTRDVEQTPRRASWAKDRRRFTNATPTGTTKVPIVNENSNLLTVGDRIGRYDQPPTPIASGRRSSLKQPSNFRNSTVLPTTSHQAPSRIPSFSSVPIREVTKPRQSSERDIDIGHTSHTDPSFGKASLDQTPSYREGRATPQVGSGRGSYQLDASNTSRTPNAIRSETFKQPQVEAGSVSGRNPRFRNRQSVVHPEPLVDEGTREPEPIIISSKRDADLPPSPFAQSDMIADCRVGKENKDERSEQPDTISSPVETVLIGSAPDPQPNVTPNSKLAPDLVRSTRESSVYALPVPVVSPPPGGRRLSEPSPKNSTPVLSARVQSPIYREPSPNIIQRLARRASFSGGKSPKKSNVHKSPKLSGTPKSTLEVDHNAHEPPFDLELETPRAAAGADSGRKVSNSTTQFGSLNRQRSRQGTENQSAMYSRTVGQDLRKLHPKVIEDVTGSNAEKLGSPFMGDGSPRFGIDERFRSPKKRTKSGLRNDASKPNDDRSQELLEYYGHDAMKNNTADYYIEGPPIGTVLSSPGHTQKEMTSSSPKAQSKRRSQYQYTSRTRPGTVKQRGSDGLPGVSSDTSDDRTPIARPQTRSSSFVSPPIITRTSVTSLESSTRSEFSDSEQEADESGHPRADVYRKESGSEKGMEGSRTPTSVRFSPQPITYEPNQQIEQAGNMMRTGGPQTNRGTIEYKVSSFGGKGRSTYRTSQLPVSRQRKTNSALFRALEQPYDGSSSNTIVSSGSSSAAEESDSPSEAKTNSEYTTTEASTEGLHTISSISSSLDGHGVGNIRWSDTHELSGAAEALFHYIEKSHSGQGSRLIAVDPNEGSTSNIIKDPSYSSDEEGDPNHDWSDDSVLNSSGSLQQDNLGKRRMPTQDKRKAIHESWRASIEEAEFERLEKVYDPMEMRRQELVWEFHHNERLFVESMRTLIHLFVQPLRAQDKRTWIAGLSPEVMKLFDWLDDISNLHEQLLDALEIMRKDHEHIIILFSETVQPFIPLMELYQPYIVHMDETIKQIVAMTLDPASDFGEFVRMQSALLRCGESLEEMMKHPLSHLQEYVPFFQTLLTLTPRTHPDYFPSFSLLHSMHGMVSVLNEVKAREEEYELTKSLLSRVRGLPSRFMLVTRESRLLAQGPLNRVHVGGEGFPEERLASTSNQSGILPTRRSRARSVSRPTTIASLTEPPRGSTSSCGTHLKHPFTGYNLYSNAPYNGCQDGRPSLSERSRTTGLCASNILPQPLDIGNPEEVEIYALVFTDYIIITKKATFNGAPQSLMRCSNDQWNTLESLGVFRVLGVTDYHGCYGYEYLISLDLIPITDTCLKDANHPVFLRVSNPEPNTKYGIPDLQSVCQKWYQSFHQCYLHTLQSISFPSQYEDIQTHTDKHGALSNQAVLPMSPSQQLGRMEKRREARIPLIGTAEEEREERKFWAERFGKVVLEMRQSYERTPRPLVPESSRSRTSEPSRVGRFRSSSTFI